MRLNRRKLSSVQAVAGSSRFSNRSICERSVLDSGNCRAVRSSKSNSWIRLRTESACSNRLLECRIVPPAASAKNLLCHALPSPMAVVRNAALKPQFLPLVENLAAAVVTKVPANFPGRLVESKVFRIIEGKNNAAE